MNLRTHSQNRSGLQVFSWVLALALVFSLVIAPAATASADSDTCSAELVFSSEGVDFSGKLALDTAKGLLGLIASITTQGETAEFASAYINAQALVVDGLLLGGAYGFDLSTLAENLPGSIFAPDSGSSFALDEESYNEILAMLSGELLPQTTVVATMDTEAVQQASAVLKEAYSGVLEDVLAELTIETAENTVEVNGVFVPVNQVRCGVDGDGIINMMLISLDVLANNTDAQAAYAIIFDQYSAISGEDQSLTGEEFVQTMLSELPQELDQAREELQGLSGAVTICMSSATEAPVKFSLEVQDSIEQVSISLLLSEAMDFFRLECVENGNAVAAFQLEIPENSASAFACKFSVEDEYQEAASMNFDLNKAEKTFVLSVLADGESHALSGCYTVEDTLFSLTIDKVDDQEFGGTLTLNLRSDDEAIAMPSFTELTAMSEEDFSALVQAVMENVQSLSSLFAA